MYHAVKFFQLAPELHWTAGGYIWPLDGVVEVSNEAAPVIGSSPPSAFAGGVPAVRGTFSTYGGADTGAFDLRSRVEDSGATPLEQAGITVLSEFEGPLVVPGKYRVPFVSGGELQRLVVNALLVLYVS